MKMTAPELVSILDTLPQYFKVENSTMTVAEFSAVLKTLPSDHITNVERENIHTVHSYPDDREYVSFHKM